MIRVSKVSASYTTPGTYSASLYDGVVEIRTPYSAHNKALCQNIAGRMGRGWDKIRQCWRYHFTRTVVRDIIASWDVQILDEDVLAFYTREIEIPDPRSKTTLWRHQRNEFRKLFSLVGGMIAFDMGTGKTLEAIALLDAWGAKKVVVIGPRSVLPIWPSEFSKHSFRSWNVVLLRDGSVARRTKEAKKELARTISAPIVFIINYAAAIRPQFKEWSLGQDWDAVVFDECHHLRAAGGVQSRYAHALSRCATRRLGLTGTPLPHSFIDVYAQYRALDSSVFGTSYTRFKAQFCVMGGYQGYEVKGMRDREEFERRLYSIMARVTKEDVFDLPPSVVVQRTAVFGKKERSVYRSLESEFWVWLEEQGQQVTIQNALVKLTRLQQVSSGFVKTDEGEVAYLGHTKEQMFEEFLEDLPLKEPLVVFCRFIIDLENVQRIATSSGRTASLLCGGTDELVDWKTEKTDVLVCQIQAGSEGIDLTRSCQCVFYSMGFSLAQHEQARARLDRAGQTRSVTYTYLIVENSIDGRILKAIKGRKQIVEAILQEAFDG